MAHKFSHLDASGNPSMVDVGDKDVADDLVLDVVRRRRGRRPERQRPDDRAVGQRGLDLDSYNFV